MFGNLVGHFLIKVAEDLWNWIGMKSPAELIFGAGGGLIAGTFTPQEWESLRRWYGIFFAVGASGLMVYAVVLVLGLKNLLSSAGPSERASLMESVWDLFAAAALSVFALPLFRGLLDLNWALVNAVSDWMGSGGMDWAAQFGKGWLQELEVPGSVFLTGLARLVFAGVCLHLNLLYFVRKFVLVVSVVLIPLFAWAWVFRGTRLPVMLLGSEILSNSFMSFSHAVVLALIWDLFYKQSPAPSAGMTAGLAAALARGVGVLVSVGALVATIVLIVQGYRLMSAVDSKARAEAMEGIRKSLVAAAFVFGAWAVHRVVVEVVLR